MNKCSICGEHNKIQKFKSGYICEDCLEFVKDFMNPYEASSSTECTRTFSSEHKKRSEERVNGSEKQ